MGTFVRMGIQTGSEACGFPGCHIYADGFILPPE